MSLRNVPRARISKSCANCRAVKRRCDRQHPHCGQCTRQGQECPGYRDEWELVFRDMTNQTVKRFKGKKGKSAASIEAQHSRRPAYFSQPRLLASSSQTSHLPQTVPWGPMMRNQLFSSYFSHYFPVETERTCNIDASQFVISGISGLPQKTAMLEKALSALSCVFLGKIHHDEHALQYGLRLYNHAMQDMSRTITRNTYTDDIIYTCVVFQQIQTHHCPYTLSEWFAHIDGLCAIMKYFRPEVLTTPILAAIYGQTQKLKVVLSGMMHLSEQQIAWLKDTNESEPLLEMIKLLAEISRIATAIDTTNVSDHDAYQSLLNECLALEKDHMDFYIQIDQNIDGEPPTYARGELKSGMLSTDDLFGPAYRFSSFDDAMLHLFFWLSLSFLYPLIRRCQIITMTDMPDYLRIDDHSTGDEAQGLATFYVGKAIRCLPYCGQKGMNSWGIFYGMLCAIQASRVYTHAKDWKRFLFSQDIFSYMELAGFEYAARFRDIWWDYWFDSRKHNVCRILDYRQLTEKPKASFYEAADNNVSDGVMG